MPRLFDGALPQFNIGTNDGRSCAPELAEGVHGICAASPFNVVLNGRFKGGFITRSLGRPEQRVHAIQMELAMRGYLPEPSGIASESNWPPAFEPSYAAPLLDVLRPVLQRCAMPMRDTSPPSIMHARWVWICPAWVESARCSVGEHRSHHRLPMRPSPSYLTRSASSTPATCTVLLE